jgi:hypothetical protein
LAYDAMGTHRARTNSQNAGVQYHNLDGRVSQRLSWSAVCKAGPRAESHVKSGDSNDSFTTNTACAPLVHWSGGTRRTQRALQTGCNPTRKARNKYAGSGVSSGLRSSALSRPLHSDPKGFCLFLCAQALRSRSTAIACARAEGKAEVCTTQPLCSGISSAEDRKGNGRMGGAAALLLS